MRLALLMLLCACDLPTHEDVDRAVDEATNKATDICRTILQEETASILQQVTSSAVSACIAITTVAQHNAEELAGSVRDSVELARDQAVYQVLVNLGCTWDGERWNCEAARLCP